jgi:hypothetical protein
MLCMLSTSATAQSLGCVLCWTACFSTVNSAGSFHLYDVPAGVFIQNSRHAPHLGERTISEAVTYAPANPQPWIVADQQYNLIVTYILAISLPPFVAARQTYAHAAFPNAMRC